MSDKLEEMISALNKEISDTLKEEDAQWAREDEARKRAESAETGKFLLVIMLIFLAPILVGIAWAMI